MSAADRTIARMPWRPVNPSHAIERVRFVVQMKQPLPDKLVRQISELTKKLQHETRLQGPIPLQGLSINVQVVDGKQHLSQSETNKGGAQFTRSASNGQPIEVLSVAGNQLAYETAEYRRWTSFKQRYDKVLREPINLIISSLDVDWVSLEYFDRFIFDGDSTQAKPGELLSNMQEFFDEDTLSGRNMWHLHRGWFHKTTSGDVLINQNFDAVDLPQLPPQAPVRSISVLTKADARALNFEVEETPISALLDFLHQQTNMHFTKALVPEMLIRIGMSEVDE